MRDRYPGYDVLSKRHTQSWNEVTRRVIDHRLSLPREPNFFTEDEWLTLNAICDRIVPQPKDRPPIPVAAFVDHKMSLNRTDGYRHYQLPKMQDAWRRGLNALDHEARTRYSSRFHTISATEQNELLEKLQDGKLNDQAWGDMPSKLFFSERMVPDIVTAYYSHPTSWNEIGFGGPASPRGYVRMGFDKRDPWEAVEAKPGHEEEARRKNRHVG
jgi:Gluconate 2-dehydrogenase subunit 3